MSQKVPISPFWVFVAFKRSYTNHHHRIAGRFNYSDQARFFFYTVFLFLLLSTSLSAQQVQSNTGAPVQDIEVANGSRLFTVTILGGSVSSGSLLVTLPTGYVYVQGATTAASGGITASERSVSANTATIALAGIPATGSSATFTFKAIAACAAIGVDGNQASYVLTPNGGAAQTERLSNEFNLKYAKLNITGLANSPSTAGVVGDTNNNGVVDAGDVQIGSMPVTIAANAAPQSFPYQFTTTYQGNLCPALVELSLACACEDTVVYAYSCDTSLPVILQSFELRQVENAVRLNWATTTETNSDHFEIEHSNDAKTWEYIGLKIAAGESSVTNKYSFTDISPVNGLNYYRLKMVDKDNSFAFSRINSIKINTDLGIIYPNAVTESITLGIANLNAVSSLEIYDSKGNRVLKATKLTSNKINVERLPTGIYLVKITQTSGAVIVQKIVKQ